MISVIVPVYRVEAYLVECVESILNQSFRDFECILVDDGSPDSCPEMCDAFAKQDSRVRVIHRENGGLSAARNSGLDAAKGEYIAFVDSDDVLMPHYLQTLLEAARATGAEITACRFREFPDGTDAGEEHLTAERRVWSRKEAIFEMTRMGEPERAVYVIIMCAKLFARRLFDDLRFPVGKIHEDEFLALPLLLRTDAFCACEAELYAYRRRADSITGANAQADERHLQVLDAYAERCRLLNRVEYRELFTEAVRNYCNAMIAALHRQSNNKVLEAWILKRYRRAILRYGFWLNHKRFFVFAVSPRWYWRRYWQDGGVDNA